MARSAEQKLSSPGLVLVSTARKLGLANHKAALEYKARGLAALISIPAPLDPGKCLQDGSPVIIHLPHIFKYVDCSV